MTISTEDRKAGPHLTNGSTTIFPFDFKVFAASELLVVKGTIADGSEETLILTDDYTAALNPDQNASPGGSITISPALPSGFTITITSDVPLTQTNNITNQGGFLPSVFNNALDKLTILIQQVALDVSRGLRFTLSSDVTDITLDTPIANRALKWNSTADGITNSNDDPDTILPAAQQAAQDAQDSADDAADSAAAALVSENNAAASETAAGISETNAAASETAAGISETNAAASAVAAENSALSVGARLVSTSTTSMSIGTGAKTCTVQTAEGWAVGMFITVYRTSDITQFMVGQITAYNTGTGQLDFSVTTGNTNGSGTYTDWTIVVGGRRGVDGSAAGTFFASATDIVQNYLDNKLTVSGNILKTLVNGGGNEAINLEAVIKVKQVQFGTLATSFSTGSGTFQDTGLTASITPSSASNKVIVIYSGLVKMESGITPSVGEIKALRGTSTDIEGNSNFLRFGSGIASTNMYDIATRVIVDSPATTSSTSYKVQIRTVTVAGGNTAVFCESGSGFLILIEYEP